MTLKAQRVQNVSLLKEGNNIAIRNGLLGIVVPTSQPLKIGERCPAPIQAFIYSNGVYSDTSFNELITPGGISSMVVDFPVNTKSEVTATITYQFNKKEFQYASRRYKGGEAGPGYYKCTITVKKRRKEYID